MACQTQPHDPDKEVRCSVPNPCAGNGVYTDQMTCEEGLPTDQVCYKDHSSRDECWKRKARPNCTCGSTVNTCQEDGCSATNKNSSTARASENSFETESTIRTWQCQKDRVLSNVTCQHVTTTCSAAGHAGTAYCFSCNPRVVNGTTYAADAEKCTVTTGGATSCTYKYCNKDDKDQCDCTPTKTCNLYTP